MPSVSMLHTKNSKDYICYDDLDDKHCWVVWMRTLMLFRPGSETKVVLAELPGQSCIGLEWVILNVR